jgi:WD40 repeat protein
MRLVFERNTLGKGATRGLAALGSVAAAILACSGLPSLDPDLLTLATSTATAAPPAGTPSATPTPMPTSTLGPRSLADQAASACESAFSSAVGAGSFSAPLISMLTYTYSENAGWDYHDLVPFYTARAAEDVKTILCIQEARDRTGAYEDGEPAYRLTWTVRVVDWPAGTVAAALSLRGSEPPGAKLGGGPGYGNQPSNELFDWLARKIVSHDVFFVGENVSALAVSPDGQKLYVGRSRRTNVTYSVLGFSAQIIVLEVGTGRTLFTLGGHKDTIGSLLVSPDGALLASTGTDSTYFRTEVRIWDAAAGRLLYTLPMEASVRGMAFSPDGAWLAIASGGQLQLVDLSRGSISSPSPDYAENVAFLVDGTLVVAGAENTLFLDPKDGSLLGTSPVLWWQAAAPDGATLLADGGDGLALVESRSGEVLTTIPVAVSYPVVAALSSELFALLDTDKDVLIWSIGSGALLDKLPGAAQTFTALALSPTLGYLATGTDNGFVKLWELPPIP